MSALPNNIATLPTMYDGYIRAGFVLVPIHKGKGPTTTKWNLRENCVSSIDQLDYTVGYGLAHTYSKTMALDIDDMEATEKLLKSRGVSLSDLLNADDAVTIESGRAGRGKLVYAMPFGLTLPSKRITYVKSDHDVAVAYELRCATVDGLTVQDVLPSAVLHPITQQPYRWGGRGHWSRLPTLPVELLTIWQELTTRDTTRHIKTDTVDASADDLRCALLHINPSCDREQWVSIGMALHSTGKPELIELWDEWSQQSAEKYQGRRDIEACWRSFKPNDGISIGTLFHYAYKSGYTRPLPDVTAMFKDVTPKEPERIGRSPSFYPEPPSADLSVWPEVLRRRVKEVAESTGCDPMVPFMAGLAAIAACCDARSRLEIVEGFKVPPVLWLLTIGDPSGKKTPGAAPMISLLRELEKEDFARYQSDLLRWEAVNAAHAASMTAYTKEAARPENSLGGQVDFNALPPVIAAPTWKPSQARLLASDITSQKLMRIVADRQRGILVHLDEMGGWCQKVTDPRSGEDKSAWTASYNAGFAVIDRVGEQASIPIDNYAVNIFGNLQPQLYKKYVNMMTDDGLLQRFIPAVLYSDRSELSQPIPSMFTNQHEYDAMLRNIYNTPTMTYRLDSQAYKVYRDFQVWYDQLKRDERVVGASMSYLQAFGKLEGNVGRIALIMHMVTTPMSPIVNHMTMINAVHFVKQYLIPIYKFTLGDTGGFTQDSVAQKVLEYVLMHSEQLELTLSMVRQGVRKHLEDVPLMQRNALIHDAMGRLESMDWVTCLNDHYSKASWVIHPGVKTVFADHRKRLIKAQQRIRDKIAEYSIEKYGRGLASPNVKYAYLLDDE